MKGTEFYLAELENDLNLWEGILSWQEEGDPIPQGKYVPATRFGQSDLTLGMTPRNNGVDFLIKTRKSAKSVR